MSQDIAKVILNKLYKGGKNMLRYEFLRCMELRSKIQEKIKGQIFIGMQDNIIKISIVGCPTCRFITEIQDTINVSTIDDLANNIYYQYRQFIFNKFFIE